MFKGPFRDRGMHDFTGELKEEDVVKIQAFIQNTADAIRRRSKAWVGVGVRKPAAPLLTLNSSRPAMIERLDQARAA